MVDSYANKQFYRFADYENQTITSKSSDNPRFLYPGSRFPNIYDTADQTDARTNTQVQRGFIRGLVPEIVSTNPGAYSNAGKYTGAKAPIRRCFFQFNPNLILRSVQASSSTMMPLLQDPTQILQPIPGQSSFEFQLMFNREREVSGQVYQNANKILHADPLTDSLASYGQSPEFSQEHVASLGVLVDLYVLDSIIGQSITKDMVDFVKGYAQQTQELRKQTTTNSDGSVTTTTSNQSSAFNAADYSDKKLSRILGNTAFLSPMPIRIVFSSLFMVEGYVTASNVAFHKFTKTMVPTVCTVTLNVQALYIGFAKKDSYVSQQLVDSIKAAKDIKEANQKILATVKTHLKNNLNISLNYPSLMGSNLALSLNDAFAGAFTSSSSKELKFYGLSATGTAQEKSLSIWGNSAFQKAMNGAIMDVSLDSLKIVFVDKDKIGKTSDEVLKAAESGTLLNSSNYVSNGIGYQQKIIASLEVTSLGSDKIEFKKTLDNLDKATKKEPLTTQWQTSNIELTGVPEGGTSTFFTSHNIWVVLIAQISATAPGEDAANAGRVSVTKAKVITEFNPNDATFWGKYRMAGGGVFSKLNFELSEAAPRNPR